jgi:hypothetical protein
VAPFSYQLLFDALFPAFYRRHIRRILQLKVQFEPGGVFLAGVLGANIVLAILIEAWENGVGSVEWK